MAKHVRGKGTKMPYFPEEGIYQGVRENSTEEEKAEAERLRKVSAELAADALRNLNHNAGKVHK